jgi:hypothetical protein
MKFVSSPDSIVRMVPEDLNLNAHRPYHVLLYVDEEGSQRRLVDIPGQASTVSETLYQALDEIRRDQHGHYLSIPIWWHCIDMIPEEFQGLEYILKEADKILVWLGQKRDTDKRYATSPPGLLRGRY